MMRPMAWTSCDQRSLLARQLRLAGRGQLVVLRALVGLADAPLGLQPAALLESVQRRIERAGLDLEQIVGLGADRLADAMAVLRPPLERSENQHVERALEQFEAAFVGRLGHSRRRSTAFRRRMSTTGSPRPRVEKRPQKSDDLVMC